MLADYFLRLGVDLRIVRNDANLEELQADPYDAVVLSPGPESPHKAGNLMKILRHYHDKIPVMGVCLGHQALGMLFGAELVKCDKPMHGKVTPVIQVAQHPVFQDLPHRFNVTRYHSLELRNLPPDLKVLLKTDKGEIMAMAHQELPLLGIQFHPEAHLTEFGAEMIQAWVTMYKLN